MADGLPAKEAVDIFNKLVRTAPAETEEIARAEWRLRSLGRTRPTDTAIEVALLYALLMGGKADEAIRVADHLWHRRDFMAAEQLGTFLFELAHIGMYERAAQILDGAAGRYGVDFGTNLHAIEVTVSWALGNIERVSAALNKEPPSVWRDWLAFVHQIDELGLVPHLAARQQIVREKTFHRQCLSQFVITPGGEYPFELTHYVYVIGSYEDRTALEEEIHTALDAYFEPFGLNENHWGAMIELIAPITAAPAWHKDFFDNAA